MLWLCEYSTFCTPFNAFLTIYLYLFLFFIAIGPIIAMNLHFKHQQWGCRAHNSWCITLQNMFCSTPYKMSQKQATFWLIDPNRLPVLFDLFITSLRMARGQNKTQMSCI